MGSPAKSRKIGVKSLGFLCGTHYQPMLCRWADGVVLTACPPVVLASVHWTSHQGYPLREPQQAKVYPTKTE